MNFTVKTFLIASISAFAFYACNGEASSESEASEVIEEVIEESTETSVEEFSIGELEGLVGDWTVDAETAGVQLDLGFGMDGSFTQKMGDVVGEGTWESVGDGYVAIATNLTEGQKMKIADLTEESMTLTWYSSNGQGTEIPMLKVQ